MINKLKTLGENLTDSRELFVEIEKQLPSLFIDSEKISSFFNGEFTNKYLVQQIIAAYEIKDYIEKHREHIKKNLKNNIQPYDLYIEKSEDNHFSKKNFNDLYDALCKVDVDNRYLRIDNKALKIIEKLNSLNISNNSKINVINCLIGDLYSGIQNASEYLNKNDTYDVCFSTLRKISDSIYKNRTLAVDIMLHLMFNEEYSDVPLETTFVYNYFQKLLLTEDNENVIVIEPSLFFIRKIFNSPTFFNKTIKIYISDDICVNVLNYAYHKKNITVENSKISSKNKAKIVLSDIVFIFGNNISNATYIESILDSVANLSFKNNNIVFFDRDFRIFTNNPIGNLLSKLNINEICLLPSEINNCTRPARKSIINCTKTDEVINELIKVNKYSLLKENSVQAISSKTRTLNVSQKDYKCLNKSFRKLFRNFDCVDESKKRYSFEYVFSKELTIRYTFSNSTRLRAEMINPFSSKDRKKTIDFTKVSVVLKSENDLENWLENIYPYHIYRDSKLKSTVQYEVSQLFKSYEPKSMTLKTFMYVYKDEINFIPSSLSNLYSDILASEISDIYLNHIDDKHINNTIDILIDKYSKVSSQYHLLNTFKNIFDVAVKYKLISINPADVLLKNANFNDSTIFEIKEALAINYLNLERRKNIILHCEKMISKNRGVYLGVLMRLFLAMLPKEICALSWSSFIEQEGFYCFVINNEISKDNEFIIISNQRKIRIIPLGPYLSNLILKEKQRQLKIYGVDDKDFNSKPIIAGKDKMANSAFKYLSTEKLYEESQKLLKKYDIDDEFLTIPTNNNADVDIDLTSTRGDIFRSNYRHYIAFKHLCSHDIYTYLLGIKGLDVFSDHYCDYKNQVSLKKIYQVQKQIEEVLLNG